MRKIIGITIAVVLVMALAAGGTWAYFSDTETVTVNQFIAGTIDISVNGENPWTATDYFTIDDIKPCTDRYIDFTITNIGENEADIWKKLTVTGYDGGTMTEPECLAEYGTWDPGTSTCSGNTPVDDISQVIDYDMMVYDGADPLGAIVIIDYADGVTLADVSGYYIYLGKLEPGASLTVVQSYHLQCDAGNEYQGDCVDFSIELYAQQINGCPIPPGTELTGYEKPTGTYVDFGDPLSELGHLNMVFDDWSYIGDANVPDSTPGYLPHNHYGGYDGGNANFRGLLGAPTGCGTGHEWATFVMTACTASDPVTTLTLRHLDGQVNDSFDVQIGLNGTWTTIGHYTAGNYPTGQETWVTTSYDLPGPLTGKLMFRLVATNGVTSWCNTWGQVMFNWAEIS